MKKLIVGFAVALSLVVLPQVVGAQATTTPAISVTNQSSSVSIIDNGTQQPNKAVLTFNFTTSNTGSRDIFISKNASIALATSTEGISASLTSSLTTVQPSSQVGDTFSVWIITPGSSRTFSYTGIMGPPIFSGLYRTAITKIYYSDSSSDLRKFNVDGDSPGLTRLTSPAVNLEGSNPTPVTIITVSSPNGSEKWIQTTTQDIKWSTSNIPVGHPISIEAKGYGTFSVIGESGLRQTVTEKDFTIGTFANQQNGGTIKYRVNLPLGTYKLVAKASVNGVNVNDMSDNTFTVMTSVSPSPTIVPQPTNATSTATNLCYTFTQYFGLGSTGRDVVALQKLLTSKGFLRLPSGVEQAYFGTTTKMAVISYQTSVGLPATGYVGPITVPRLNAECSNPSRNYPSISNVIIAFGKNPTTEITKGKDYVISWNESFVKESVNVYLKRLIGNVWTTEITIATVNPVGTGEKGQSVVWSVPTDLKVFDTRYKIYVETIGAGGQPPEIRFVTATTTPPSIPFISLFSPTPGQKFTPGSVVPIRWTSNLSGGVSVDVMTADETRTLISTSLIGNPGTYNFTLPSTTSYGLYIARVRGIGGLVSTVSFTVGPPPIIENVACPSGYTCVAGTTAPSCPSGYNCVTQTYNCPKGYTCMTSTKIVNPEPSYSPSPSTYTTPSVSPSPTQSTTATPSPTTSSTPTPSTSVAPASVTLTSNKTTNEAGKAVVLTWSSSNTVSCSSNWSSNIGTSGTATLYPTASITYSLTCKDSAQTSTTKTVYVQVQSAPASSSSPRASATYGTNFLANVFYSIGDLLDAVF